MSNFLWETSWHGRNLQTSADYWDTQYFLFWQKFHDQSFCSDCEKTEHESTFLKLSVDSALSIDFKNGLIFENCQFNSWPMSKNLYNWFLSCTFFHVTFLTSDHFFLIVLVKILIFSCKKSAHVEIQLLVLLKFWLSLGLMKKEKKYLALTEVWTGDTQLGVRSPRHYTTETSYRNWWFYWDICYIIPRFYTRYMHKTYVHVYFCLLPTYISCLFTFH